MKKSELICVCDLTKEWTWKDWLLFFKIRRKTQDAVARLEGEK